MATKVVNLRRDNYDIYVGRPGRGQEGYFGNPVKIGRPCPVPLCGQTHSDAGSTLPCFKRYFVSRYRNDPEFRRRAKQLRNKTLGCFCKPGPCHGDVIAELLDNLCKCGYIPCRPEEHSRWSPQAD